MKELKNITIEVEVNDRDEQLDKILCKTDKANDNCFGYNTDDYNKYAIECNWRVPEVCGDCHKAYEDFFLNEHCKRKDVFNLEEKCPNCIKGYMYPHPSGELVCDKCHLSAL